MFEYDFTVQYVDIDSNNQLSDYGIFKCLQEIGCLHANDCGYGLDDTPKNRLAWIILDWKLQVLSRPGWNTKIHIKTWPSKIDNVCCWRDFKVTDEFGKDVAIASSKWVLINIDTHKISKITPDIKEAFSPIEKPVFNAEIQRIDEPNSYQSSFKYTVLRRDIDTNKHLNNLNYILLAKQALPKDVYENMNFNNIQVMYKHQCILDDTVLFNYSKLDENEHIVAIKNEDESVLHAIVKFKLSN